MRKLFLYCPKDIDRLDGRRWKLIKKILASAKCYKRGKKSIDQKFNFRFRTKKAEKVFLLLRAALDSIEIIILGQRLN